MALRSSSRSSAYSYKEKKLRYARSLSSDISFSALSYQTSDRIKSLSKPRTRRETNIRDDFSRYECNPRYSGVSRAASFAQCSPRVNDLAVPLKRYSAYVFEWTLPRAVSPGALRYQSSERINELAAPKILPGVIVKF